MDRAKYELMNLATQESHGLFNSEDECHRIADQDGVEVFEITRGYETGGDYQPMMVVASVDRRQRVRERVRA